MAQNWNSLLSYIKLKLGVPTNMLELTDDDIIKYIKENTIPELSQYLYETQLFLLTCHNLDTTSNPLYGANYYTIPAPPDVEIIDVYKVYLSNNTISIGLLTTGFLTIDPRDIAMQNELMTMMTSLQPVQTYKYIRPNKILFEQPLTGDCIVEARIVLQNIAQIPSDFYHDIFKEKCLADVISLVVSQRSKYESLSTPFGQLNLNWQYLDQYGKEILAEINSKLDAIPPEYYIEWID